MLMFPKRTRGYILVEALVVNKATYHKNIIARPNHFSLCKFLS